jgi:hypothetical protein
VIPTDNGTYVVTGRHSRSTKNAQALWVCEVRGSAPSTRILKSYELTALARLNGFTAEQCAELGKRHRS